MSDDLVKRLRDGCSCNIDSSPCMAEEECRDAYAAADRIEQLESRLYQCASDLQIYMDSFAASVATNEELKALIKDFFEFLDKTEETDEGRVFHPNRISSCRALDAEKLGEVLVGLKHAVTGVDK